MIDRPRHSSNQKCQLLNGGGGEGKKNQAMTNSSGAAVWGGTAPVPHAILMVSYAASNTPQQKWKTIHIYACTQSFVGIQLFVITSFEVLENVAYNFDLPDVSPSSVEGIFKIMTTVILIAIDNALHRWGQNIREIKLRGIWSRTTNP